MANWSQLVFPRMLAPAALSFATQVASKGGLYPSKTRDPAVVANPCVHSVSCNRTQLFQGFSGVYTQPSTTSPCTHSPHFLGDPPPPPPVAHQCLVGAHTAVRFIHISLKYCVASTRSRQVMESILLGRGITSGVGGNACHNIQPLSKSSSSCHADASMSRVGSYFCCQKPASEAKTGFLAV